VAETDDVLQHLVSLLRNPQCAEGAAWALDRVAQHLPQEVADTGGAVPALVAVLTADPPYSHQPFRLPSPFPSARQCAESALAAIADARIALADRGLEVDRVLPALLLTVSCYEDSSSGLLRNLARAKPARVAAAIARKAADPDPSVRRWACRILESSKLSQFTFLDIMASAAAEEVAELRARVEELKAIPVNVRAAIVDLAAAARGGARQRRDA